MPQELLTTSERRAAGSFPITWSSLLYESTASLSSPAIVVAPGVRDRRTAWSRSVARGAASETSYAHIVPCATGCLPGVVATPAGVKLFDALSCGVRPLLWRKATLTPVSTTATGTPLPSMPAANILATSSCCFTSLSVPTAPSPGQTKVDSTTGSANTPITSGCAASSESALCWWTPSGMLPRTTCVDSAASVANARGAVSEKRSAPCSSATGVGTGTAGNEVSSEKAAVRPPSAWLARPAIRGAASAARAPAVNASGPARKSPAGRSWIITRIGQGPPPRRPVAALAVILFDPVRSGQGNLRISAGRAATKRVEASRHGPGPAASARRSLRDRLIRSRGRALRPLLRDAGIHRRADDSRHPLDRPERESALLRALRPVPLHPAEPRLLHAGRVRRAVDPSRPAPASGAGSAPGREDGGFEARVRGAAHRPARDERAADRTGGAARGADPPLARLLTAASGATVRP